ncbi:hypothetical protein CGL51_09105 [Pyrobaculum aerophilum]|uniref:HIT-type domain-containing protein n=1 Tax=Pyrobaculum aerophilum TaxID=13773 RepID=A0A371QWT6_9CREN|nr:hypothetical protein CGL51_09105 [Pyrobaculum aerophilum]RFB00096.1 hypothetical protein CGL52_01740 [Pyrobaculum aerophilum]
MVQCYICGFEEAKYKCPKCGRLVCRHDWAGAYCAACEATLCRLCKSNFSISVCIVCGRLVCEKCSVRRGLGRVCKDCMRNLS